MIYRDSGGGLTPNAMDSMVVFLWYYTDTLSFCTHQAQLECTASLSGGYIRCGEKSAQLPISELRHPACGAAGCTASTSDFSVTANVLSHVSWRLQTQLWLFSRAIRPKTKTMQRAAHALLLYIISNILDSSCRSSALHTRVQQRPRG